MDNNLIKRMYGRKSEGLSEKNPNRIAGGLRAQGVDTLMILDEDGQEKEIPSKRYVEALEENLRKQQAVIESFQSTVNKQSKTMRDLESKINHLEQKLKERG